MFGFRFQGSPPLARGNRVAAIGKGALDGFTPARAGKSLLMQLPTICRQVHPRSRGEIDALDITGGYHRGSPPLARGNPGGVRRGRVSPAVHPRSRGEIVAPSMRWRWPWGSPPLARGNRPASGARRCLRRFTPARAGKSRAYRRRRSKGSVHPRSRGEIQTARGVRLARGGSPPLARGNHRRPHLRQRSRRFTPARAGKSTPIAASSTRPTVHPRSRGEIRLQLLLATLKERFTPARAGKSFKQISRRKHSGVHPRSRGEIVRFVGQFPASIRFTPARAGKSLPGKTREWAEWVHPRSRGEIPRPQGVEVGDHGSPPLARGNRVASCGDAG